MLKQFTIYFLIIVLIIVLNIPIFSNVGILMYYQANKEYIAKVLCVNKNRPSLHCDGKCYLAQKLKAAEEREQKQTAERLEKMPEIQLFCSSNYFIFNDFCFVEFLQDLPNFNFLANPLAGLLKGVFRPPQS